VRVALKVFEGLDALQHIGNGRGSSAAVRLAWIGIALGQQRSRQGRTGWITEVASFQQ
jgi:hypothetical protein